MIITTAKQKIIAYCSISASLAVCVTAIAFVARPSFYSACIALSHGLNAVILGNFFFVLLAGLGKLLQTVLFGELRIIEIEHIYERAWYTVTNSLVALAMFRNEQILLLASLTLLQLFMKVFHWILKDRMKFLLQRASVPKNLIENRIFWLISFFIFIDYTISKTFLNLSFISSADVYLIFGLDCVLEGIDLFIFKSKILLDMFEMAFYKDTDDQIWERKSLFVKLFDIGHSVVKVLIHALLFYVLIGPYRMPLHVFRGSFLSIKDLVKQVIDFRRYLKASKQLDTLLQNATEEELERDNLCIICREDMTTIGIVRGSRQFPKKLNCNHIIHLGCLKDWLERSQSCPMCRQSVFRENSTQESQQNTTQPDNQTVNAGEGRNESNERIPTIHDDGIRVRPVETRDSDVELGEIVEQDVWESAPPSSEGESNMTPTPQEIASSHSITLPSSAKVIPPDWSILPITRVSQDLYQVKLSPISSVPLKIVPRKNANGISTIKLNNLDYSNSESISGNEKKISDVRDEVAELKAEIAALKKMIRENNGTNGLGTND